MQKRLRIFTHESIVHSQVATIQKILGKEITFDIIINSKGARSNIQFMVSSEEMDQLLRHLGYQIFIQTDNHWVPHF
jgi:hypothetical protein